METFQMKEEEENSMHNTVVMFSTSDHFTLKQVRRRTREPGAVLGRRLSCVSVSLQDMCVVCGSFGQGAEGRLLACSQCGQCYHPYCVNVKVAVARRRCSLRVWVLVRLTALLPVSPDYPGGPHQRVALSRVHGV